MELSKEEQEAIEQFEYWIEFEKENKDKINKADELIKIQTTLLNLINKQSKIIDEMAEYIRVKTDFTTVGNINAIKQYFYRKVERR